MMTVASDANGATIESDRPYDASTAAFPRRSDRIAALFAALHESGIGANRRHMQRSKQRRYSITSSAPGPH